MSNKRVSKPQPCHFCKAGPFTSMGSHFHRCLPFREYWQAHEHQQKALNFVLSHSIEEAATHYRIGPPRVWALLVHLGHSKLEDVPPSALDRPKQKTGFNSFTRILQGEQPLFRKAERRASPADAPPPRPIVATPAAPTPAEPTPPSTALEIVLGATDGQLVDALASLLTAGLAAIAQCEELEHKVASLEQDVRGAKAALSQSSKIAAKLNEQVQSGRSWGR